MPPDPPSSCMLTDTFATLLLNVFCHNCILPPITYILHLITYPLICIKKIQFQIDTNEEKQTNDLVTKYYKLECNQCGMPCKKVTVSNHHPRQPISPSELKVHHCCHSIFKAPPPPPPPSLKKMRTGKTTKVMVISDKQEELEIKMNDQPLAPDYNKSFFIPCKGALPSYSAAYKCRDFLNHTTLEVLL